MTSVPHPKPDPDPGQESWEYQLTIPGDVRAPGVARATLYAVLTAHGLPQLVDAAVLLTSELTTNSVRYAEGPAGVRLAWAYPYLRISVWDTNPELPPVGHPLMPEHDSQRGRGLLLLARCADRWGGHCSGQEPFGVGGKLIWFELAAG